MPHRPSQSARRPQVGLRRAHGLVRESGDRLYHLISCWREHAELVERVLEIERRRGRSPLSYCQYGDLGPSEREETDCAITRLPFTDETDICILPCGHYFTREPCGTWLSTQGVCPLCRAVVPGLYRPNVRVFIRAWNGEGEDGDYSREVQSSALGSSPYIGPAEDDQYERSNEDQEQAGID